MEDIYDFVRLGCDRTLGPGQLYGVYGVGSSWVQVCAVWVTFGPEYDDPTFYVVSGTVTHVGDTGPRWLNDGSPIHVACNDRFAAMKEMKGVVQGYLDAMPDNPHPSQQQ